MPLPASPSPDSPPEISGYTLVEQLYLGSRTAVYRAIRTADQRPVVIKVLRRKYPSFSELVQFRNQYAIAKNLPIPGIVQPLSLEPLGSGYALILEDCGGVALGKYIQQQSLGLTEVLEIALQIADILQGLYQHRVVHKDLKPANILIHPVSKQINLIDFSIASLLPKETQEIQSPNILEGTLAYLAPEQTGRMNRGIDYRADFYALGVTLYQLLTGTLPFVSDAPLELIHCHLAQMPVPANQVKAGIPPIVAAIVAKLMAKNAEDRYQSAPGLKHDLTQCLNMWQATGNISPFELGQRDWSDRFLIPEKLYGREAEIQVLLAAFDRVAQGSAELMLVAGFSGIGKTSVVNEVHKPIVRQRGYFIRGKFDQFNRNIPFSAFVQAFRDLMGQLLSESDTQLQGWKTSILNAAGDNAQVIIEVIPELEKIIGTQPPATDLSGTAAQKRFNLVFQNFIQVFTQAAHPLVIFLDDLQWADSASLKLIELLISESQTGYLLVIGAYRDNEIFSAHPLMLTLNKIGKIGAKVQTLTIKSLPQDSMHQLVSDTLKSSLEQAQLLTDLIAQKTQGNPFFATQFLKALHHSKQLTFDSEEGCWQYDIAKLRSGTVTNDVVELVSQQLQKLPAETQTVLKLAACIGNQFDLNTLAIVAQQSPATTAKALWKALQEDLVLPTSQTYKYFQEEGIEASDLKEIVQNQTINLSYRFVHDRIQQAAHTLIPEDQQKATHLEIGRLLVQNRSDLEANLFEIVNHWNTALELVHNADEKAQLAYLNWRAGCKAKASVAYEPALQYFKTGLALLASDYWQTQADLALNLYEGGIKTAFLCGDYVQMDAWAEAVLQQRTTLLTQIKIYDVKIQAQMAQGKPTMAIQIALDALKLLDITFPEAPTPSDIEEALQRTRALWEQQEISELIDLPLMVDPEKIAAIVILSSIFAPSFIGKPEILPLIACQQVQLSIRYGNCEHSAFGYSNYSAILNMLCHDLEASYQFGQLAIHLVDKLHGTEVKARTFNQSAIFSMHGKVHLREALPILQEGCRSGMENGDLEFAGYAAYNWSQYSYFSGLNLRDLQEGVQTYEAFLSQINQKISLSYNQLVYQVTLNLLEPSENPCYLVGDVFDERAALDEFMENQVFSGIQYLFTHKIALSCFFSNFEKVVDYIDQAERHLDASTGMIMVPEFYFFSALASLQSFMYKSAEEQAQALPKIEQFLAEMSQWAAQAPMNFQHKFDLLRAEQSRILGDFYGATDFYDRAIAGANANGYIQEEALANELAAKFYLSWGKEKIAQDYVTHAYYGYAHWGAKAKVQDLECRYANLLAPILQPQHTSLSTTETVFSPVIYTPSQAPGKDSSASGSTSISATLDLTTILKASQALSKEIELDKLLATLLDIVLQNAGADRAILLMPKDQQWFVEAVSSLGKPAQMVSILLDECATIPKGLIHTVKRGQDPVVIVDATVHPTLATDAYVIQQQPKSVLCTPIVNQGKRVAVLYLENRVTAGAFTGDRVELLNFLCAQAAISLENARLYQQAQEDAQQLQRKEAQSRGIFEAVSDGLLITDLETGKVMDANPAYYQLHGYSYSEILGLDPLDFIPPNRHDKFAAFLKIVKAGQEFTCEAICKKRDGTPFYIELKAVPFLYNGKRCGLSVIRDVTERKHMELSIHEKNHTLEQAMTELQYAQMQMIQSEKMSALGNLVAGVAHEINNPIGFLNGSINNARDYVQDLFSHLTLYQQYYSNPAAPVQDHAEDIDLDFLWQDLPKLLDSMRGATDRIKSISTSLRTFSRADTECKVSANLHEGIDSTLLILKYRLKANEKRPAIQVVQDYGELPPIECFSGQLNQVFMNILANAIDVFDEAAQGFSFTDLEAQPQVITIQTTALIEQNVVEVRIRDNGTGMAEDVKTRIFDHLFTTKGVGKGTGLGLAIAHQIVVESHGGRLEVQSELGQGSEFLIRLPIHT